MVKGPSPPGLACGCRTPPYAAHVVPTTDHCGRIANTSSHSYKQNFHLMQETKRTAAEVCIILDSLAALSHDLRAIRTSHAICWCFLLARRRTHARRSKAPWQRYAKFLRLRRQQVAVPSPQPWLTGWMMPSRADCQLLQMPRAWVVLTFARLMRAWVGAIDAAPGERQSGQRNAQWRERRGLGYLNAAAPHAVKIGMRK